MAISSEEAENLWLLSTQIWMPWQSQVCVKTLEDCRKVSGYTFRLKLESVSGGWWWSQQQQKQWQTHLPTKRKARQASSTPFPRTSLDLRQPLNSAALPGEGLSWIHPCWQWPCRHRPARGVAVIGSISCQVDKQNWRPQRGRWNFYWSGTSLGVSVTSTNTWHLSFVLLSSNFCHSIKIPNVLCRGLRFIYS